MFYQIKRFTLAPTLTLHPSYPELVQPLCNVQKQDWKVFIFKWALRFAPTFGGILFLSGLCSARGSLLGLGAPCSGGTPLVTADPLGDPLGTLSLGGMQEGSLWSFHWTEGWVPLLKISLGWIWAVAQQMQPCPALVNLSHRQGVFERSWMLGWREADCFPGRREISFCGDKWLS